MQTIYAPPTGIQVSTSLHFLLWRKAAHEIRLRCATAHLPPRPLSDYGLARIVREVRETVGVTVGPDVIEYLPAAIENFHGLES